MRYIDCCKSTRKNKKCTRKDGKHFSLQRRFTKKKCIKGPVKGFTMRASCAPYKFCKQKGGTRKTRKLLPKLRKISYKNKKHHYKLKDPFSKRKLAIHEGVNREARKTGKTKKKAAIAKKGRFNILRIYRKNKKIKECNTITHDMRYMDRKYGLGKTKNICGQKGGTYNFTPDRPDSTFSNIDDLKFILSFYSPHNNNKIITKSYTGDEDEHQLKPELASDTHILIVGADYGIPFSLFQGAGFEIKPKGVEEYLRYVEPIDQSGGKKRKRKTRKKRGGNDPPWQRETLQPNPETFDDIGYFYDCKPMPMIGSTNKSKYRENMIITGDRDGNELTLPDEWKIIRMNDSETYDPQLQLVDMALPEGERGMRWFRRRAQSLCNRGYKPLKRNDSKTGAGRKKRTRKKRGAVKFGKNKTTAEIVKKGREVLKTTPQRKRRERREQQIKFTGEKEFALFRKQSLIEMGIAFQTTFGTAPSNRDRKILSLVYKSLKEPLSEAEEDDIKKYRAEDEENKRKFVWMNNYLRQLKNKSQRKKFEIYNHGSNPQALLKYNTGKKKVKKGGLNPFLILFYTLKNLREL